MEEVAKKLSGFVQRANGYWYYRARVPKDLLRFYPEREKWISLGTKDEADAKVKFHLCAAEKLREYEATRQKYAVFLGQQLLQPSSGGVFVVDREEAVLLARAYLAECLSTKESRMTMLDYPTTDIAKDVRDELRTDLGNLGHLEDSDDGRFMVYNTANILLQRGGYERQPGQGIDPDFLSLVRRTLVALRTIELARLHGNFSDEPHDEELKKYAETSFSVGSARVQAVTVRNAIDKFWKAEIEFEPKADKTLLRYKASLDLLARFLGPETLFRHVAKEKLLDYRDTLMRMPSNYSKHFSVTDSFDYMTMEAEKRQLPTMSYKTREIYVSLMKRVFKWGSSNDFIHKDISVDIKIGGQKTAGRNKRRAFFIPELSKIFAAPVFTGCENDGHSYAKPGPNHPKRSRFWLPIIALYTGMRMGEILQLRTEHVRRSPKGNYFFYLTDGFGEDDGDQDFIGMELKTLNSRREVPIHRAILDMGFIDFVERKRSRGESELFPEVQKAADGKKSTIFSKRFSRFLRKCGVKPDESGNCFHMFRHTLRDAIRREPMISEEIANAVLGWANNDEVGRSYGSGFGVDDIAEAWERLNYPGLDLTHLGVHGRDVVHIGDVCNTNCCFE